MSLHLPCRSGPNRGDSSPADPHGSATRENWEERCHALEAALAYQASLTRAETVRAEHAERKLAIIQTQFAENADTSAVAPPQPNDVTEYPSAVAAVTPLEVSRRNIPDAALVDEIVARTTAAVALQLHTAFNEPLLAPRAHAPTDVDSPPLEGSLLSSLKGEIGAPESQPKVIRLPPVLSTSEFAFLIRETPESVRRRIRDKEITAHGRPAKIPCRELLKFGVDLADAARLLHERSESRSKG